MYKAKLIVLILTAALLAGCSAGVGTSQSALAEPTYDLPYEIMRDDDGYYLLLEDDIVTDDLEGSFSEESPNIKFGSMEEMVQDIRTGNFTDDELKVLSEFVKDDDGRIDICNLSKLYNAYTPDKFDNNRIIWTGNTYTFEFLNNDNKYYCAIYGEISNTDKEKAIEDLINGSKLQDATVLSREQKEERNATVVTYSMIQVGITYERKMMYYTIENGNKNVFVVEKYALSTDTVPSIIEMFGIENGVNYYVGMTYPQERPSVEYLMGFGFREYVETEVA